MTSTREVVLVADGDNITFRLLGANLKRRNFPADNVLCLNRENGFSMPTVQCRVRAFVYEPYPAMLLGADLSYKQTLDGLINKAKESGARLVAFTSQTEEALGKAGFYKGQHYDEHFQKPVKSMGSIVDYILS
jgi:hypothetical protein